MRATKVRTTENKKLDLATLTSLARALEYKLLRAGYITEVTALTHTTLKVGMHMKCFVIDQKVHGKNVRYSDYSNSLTGWTYTNIPTWDQRVEFNNIINAFLDSEDLRCNIKSGIFTVRCYERGGMNEDVWTEEQWNDSAYRHASLYGVTTKIDPATEEHEEERKEARRKRNKELREAKKAELSKPQLQLVNSN